MRLCETIASEPITLIGINDPTCTEELVRLGRDEWFGYEKALGQEIKV